MFFRNLSDYPEDLAEALERANVYYHVYAEENTVCLNSRNQDAPLTEDEKQCIADYLKSSGCMYQIIFV